MEVVKPLVIPLNILIVKPESAIPAKCRVSSVIRQQNVKIVSITT